MRVLGNRDMQRAVALRLQCRVPWQSGRCNFSMSRRHRPASVPMAGFMDIPHDKTTLDVQIASDDRPCNR